MTGCGRCHGGWLLDDDGGQGTAERCGCVSSDMEAERRGKVSELGPVRRAEDGYQPDKFRGRSAGGSR